MDDTLRWPCCKTDATEVVVQFGTYSIRCAACGEAIVATSFLAVSDTDLDVSAFIDSGYGNRPQSEALIARGPFLQIAKNKRYRRNGHLDTADFHVMTVTLFPPQKRFAMPHLGSGKGSK